MNHLESQQVSTIRKANLYIKGQGNVEVICDKVEAIESTHTDNTAVRTYEIWKETNVPNPKFRWIGMDFFVIPKHSPWIDENILQDNQLKQKLLDYTQDLDNNIVEVYYIDDEMIITKFYPNLYPSIIKSSTNWYTEDILKKRSDIHFNCFRDKEYAKNFHNKIVDEYKRFNNETGFFFSDIGPNNTLVDDDYSDFKIVEF